MFLDDKLIQICIDAEIFDRPEDIQLTYNKLIDACQDHYKKQVHLHMPKKEVKVIIDRTFLLWDSFVRMALQHDSPKVRILGGLCGKFPFKNAFFEDPKLSAFYNEHLK
jgi:hypothetical protein